jgi:hypothetical protein
MNECKFANNYTTYRVVVPVNERLAVILRLLTTDDSYTGLQYIFEISKQAIGQVIPGARSLHWLYPSVVFSVFIVILGMRWISEHRLRFVQFCEY